jgi:hypothetical protein
MAVLRRHLARFAGAWLAFQLAVLTLAPAAICMGKEEAAAAVACTCAHGDGQICPMHHTVSTSKTKTCSCRSSTDTAAVVLASLFGQTAVLVPPFGATDPLISFEQTVRIHSDPIDSFLKTDSPPPRL